MFEWLEALNGLLEGIRDDDPELIILALEDLENLNSLLPVSGYERGVARTLREHLIPLL